MATLQSSENNIISSSYQADLSRNLLLQIIFFKRLIQVQTKVSIMPDFVPFDKFFDTRRPKDEDTIPVAIKGQAWTT